MDEIPLQKHVADPLHQAYMDLELVAEVLHIHHPYSSVDGLTVDLEEDVSVVEPEAPYLLPQTLPSLDPSRPKSIEFHIPGFINLYGFVDVVHLAFLELFPHDLQLVVEDSFVLDAYQDGSGEVEVLQGQVIITVSVLEGTR